MDKVRACFLGHPLMGSWQIRAQQIASARPWWRCGTRLRPDDVLEHDVFCFVKRPEPTRMRMLRRLGKTVVFDALDCWKQPEDGLACDTMDRVRDWFRAWFAGLALDGVIFANRTMLEDLGDLVPNPVTIYHHFRPGLQPIEVRPRARVVGYEGEPSYLGEWHAIVVQECRNLGLEFVVNPPDFAALDIGFAARAGAHGSLMAHRYKSNVKLVNFIGAGLPCLVNDSDLAYRETGNEHVRYFANRAELAAGLAALLPYETRLAAHRSFLALRPQYTLEAIARHYEAYFARLRAQRCAAEAHR